MCTISQWAWYKPRAVVFHCIRHTASILAHDRNCNCKRTTISMLHKKSKNLIHNTWPCLTLKIRNLWFMLTFLFLCHCSGCTYHFRDDNKIHYTPSKLSVRRKKEKEKAFRNFIIYPFFSWGPCKNTYVTSSGTVFAWFSANSQTIMTGLWMQCL